MQLTTTEASAVWTLGDPHESLGWTLLGGGRSTVERVEWHLAQSSDLTPGVDPGEWLSDRITGAGRSPDSVAGFLTSRRVSALVRVDVDCEFGTVTAIATVGLGNALRAGDAPGTGHPGTINLAVRVPCPLGENAMVETLALAQEARALAVVESGVRSIISRAPASGTGTDCGVVLAPREPGEAQIYAGKHTSLGSAVGRAAHDAVRAGIQSWSEDRGVLGRSVAEVRGRGLVLVGGGVRSGKSRFAELRARALASVATEAGAGQGAVQGKPLYMATAAVYDDEMRKRVERHQADRGSLFETREVTHGLAAALQSENLKSVRPPAVLVDCLTLWLSNLLCDDLDDAEIERRIEGLVDVASGLRFPLVVVSNEVGLGIVPESPLGRRFRDHAGRLHQQLSRASDEVYLAALGTVMQLKPGPVRVVPC